MDIFLAILLFVVGIVLTVKGADIFIDASSWLSNVTGISKAIIGATVVAVATSAPEFFVSLFATLKGHDDMSTANIVGSIIANLGIGLAIIAICRPGKNEDRLFLTRGIIMVVATAALFIFALTGTITWLHGLILMVLFAFFTYINIKGACSEGPSKVERTPTNGMDITKNVLMFVLGIAGVLVGANIIVDNAIELAKMMGISEMIIGLTIVAVGTSLPEIVTTIAAIAKKENALGIGNIVGSNIFDTTGILAIIAFVGGGIPAAETTAFIDLPVAILLSLITVLPTAITKKVHRWQGVALFALYMGYIVTSIIIA